MEIIRKVIVILALFFFSFNVFIGVQASFTSKDRITGLVDELYNKGRLGSYLIWLKDNLKIKDMVEHKLSRMVVEVANNIIFVRYDNNYFYSSVKKALGELPVDNLLELIRWYSNALGEKVSRVEAQANDPGTMALAEQYYRNNFSEKKSEYRQKKELRIERKELLGILLEKSSIIRVDMELAWRFKTKTRGIIKELQPMLDSDGVGGIDELLYLNNKKGLKDIIFSKAMVLFIYIYRELTDEELYEYSKHLHSDSMNRFNKAIQSAIFDMI